MKKSKISKKKSLNTIRQHIINRNQNIAGRPTAINEKTLDILIDCISKWLTDQESCLIAWIHVDTLYTFQKKHEWFSDYKKALRESPKTIAKLNAVEFLEKKDKQFTQFYLEKQVDGFKKVENPWSLTQINVYNNLEPQELTQEMQNKLNQQQNMLVIDNESDQTTV